MLPPYPYTNNILAELETFISRERLRTYLNAARQDSTEAMQLYTWNTAISAAFYEPLQGLEVALRNAVHDQLSAQYGPTWFDNPRSGLDNGAIGRISAAKTKLTRDGQQVTPSNIVAVLSFGFWTSLFHRGGAIVRGQPGRRDYEMTLWRPALRRAFPNQQVLTRNQVYQSLNELRNLRNRIAHHEPIFFMT